MKFSRFNFLFSEAGGEEGTGGGGGGGDQQQQQEAPPSLINGDGTFGENWHTQLGDEFAPHAGELGKYKDIKGLAKSLVHFRSTGPAYPGEGAQPEDISRFHALAQVPVEGTAMAYGITIPEGATDEEKAVFDRIAKVAHENHLSGPGFAKVVAEYSKMQQEQLAGWQDQIAAQQKAAEDALIGEWRGNFEANKSTVRHIAGKLAEQAGVSPDDPSVASMVNNPAFAKIMLQVSKLTSEDSIRPPGGLGDLRGAQQRADSIMDGTDPVWGKKYTEGTTEEKQAAYREVVRLQTEAKK